MACDDVSSARRIYSSAAASAGTVHVGYTYVHATYSPALQRRHECLYTLIDTCIMHVLSFSRLYSSFYPISGQKPGVQSVTHLHDS